MRQQTNKTENGRANPETINWNPQIYIMQKEQEI